ncbi:CPBP family intramembrane metalloprotease [Nocardiopsis akebiae]|uniref:CPBP family intramembrane metalloprotease n=1 Tax=Nocardiopsis akebiae TaxID=2831968 RepID=A0ABX8C676_9ACTN|nr:type II CAAX endopeptidase family protein [Nocardiopsis akebiae]QUX28073.1 CPBP family intramembrane metalloprotease [Nocardiopsis akebiae]
MSANAEAHPGQRPTAPDAQGGRRPRVGWPEIVVGTVVALVLYAVGILLFLQIPAESTELGGLAQYAISGLAPLGGFAAAVLVRVRGLGPFGLRRVSAKWLAVAFGAGILMIVLNVASTTAIFLYSGAQDTQASYQAAAAGGLAFFAAALLLGGVLTPIGEEFFFRGILANALSRYGQWVAVPVSSAVFALAHGVNYLLPVAFVAGVIAAVLLHRTRSVWPGVVVHVVNNSYSVIAPAVMALMV